MYMQTPLKANEFILFLTRSLIHSGPYRGAARRVLYRRIRHLQAIAQPAATNSLPLRCSNEQRSYYGAWAPGAGTQRTI